MSSTLIIGVWEGMVEGKARGVGSVSVLFGVSCVY